MSQEAGILVQLALGTAGYADELCDLLASSGTCRVAIVSKPDLKTAGVWVVNQQTLDYFRLPIERPGRVVLITSNNRRQLNRAWNLGIETVVFASDPLRTTALAIISAVLRVKQANVGPGCWRRL